MTELVLAVSFALIISACCSLFEAVLYSVPSRQIEAMVQAGKASGRIFKSMRADVEKPLAAILSLNTVANTAGAAVAGSAASTVFGQSRPSQLKKAGSISSGSPRDKPASQSR